MTPTALALLVPLSGGACVPPVPLAGGLSLSTADPTGGAAGISIWPGPATLHMPGQGAYTREARPERGVWTGNAGTSAHFAGGETPAPIPAVPLPASIWLMLAALGALLGLRRARG